MEDIQRLTACADLERLAAAAATMGYSSDSLPVPAHHHHHHHLPAPVTTTTLASTIVPQYTTTATIAADPYDLSRAQQYAAVTRLTEYQQPSRTTVYEQTRTSSHPPPPAPPTTTTTLSSPSHTHARAPHHQYSADRVAFPPLPSRTPQYTTTTTIPITVTDHNSTAPAATIQYTDVKVVNANTVSTGVPLTQSSLLPIAASPVSQAVSQAVMTFFQEGSSVESATTAVVAVAAPHPQEKRKRKGKKIDQPEKKSEKLPIIGESTANEGPSVNGEEKVNIMMPEVPEPILVENRKYYICSVCDSRFLRKYQFRRHLISHTGEKRGALSLETKVEIIHRIQSGEKQVDLAMEYNVGRSTLSFIMKHSDKFLAVWKNGKFHPDSKRLRGAQREDVEEALYEWYKQALQVHLTITGPILCQKAKDFALKLGYKEFKATHGWLDRFKHRRNITLGRGKPNKEKDNPDDSETSKGDFTGQVLPSVLMEFESNDVFHADEIGLLYRILPNKASIHKGDRCAGGSKSKHRVTVLMCTNMTGTEKFPLLVIGKHGKPKCFKNVKSLPVQYLANPKSWMTSEMFTAWLHDLDSWFVQQNRKVLLILPSRPIHPKSPKLIAVKVLTSPPTFIGPCKLGIAHSLKRNYRRAVLETLISVMEEGDINSKKKKKSKQFPMRLNLLACLHLLAAAWHAVTDVTINNSFQRSGIGKFAIWGMNLIPETNLGTENLELIHKLRSRNFKIPDGITFDEFVMFDDEVQVCHLMDDDDIIAAVTGADVESSDSEEEEEPDLEHKVKVEAKEKGESLSEKVVDEQDYIEDGAEETEEDGPAMTEVDASLDTLRQHIQYQQEGAQEMFRVLTHLEFLIHKGAAAPSKTADATTTVSSATSCIAELNNSSIHQSSETTT
ncbi:hypothetical protein Pcinc_007250 [Petrolisthes cinctipes]|uniref:Tigger transposable element-derived protein 4 n=1 Tax=Petrolisthes cinctipes TaxID=88211 RepID=A0AAE1G9N9_PETCI|nr:hypothetical protein Pcinc_007250 [Petrolisthes cinctipes]